MCSSSAGGAADFDIAVNAVVVTVVAIDAATSIDADSFVVAVVDDASCVVAGVVVVIIVAVALAAIVVVDIVSSGGFCCYRTFANIPMFSVADYFLL